MNRRRLALTLIHWSLAVLFLLIAALIWPPKLTSWASRSVLFLVTGTSSVFVALGLSAKKKWVIIFSTVICLAPLFYLRDFLLLTSAGSVSVEEFVGVFLFLSVLIGLEVITISHARASKNTPGAATNSGINDVHA